jgi:hypothetical protein
VRQMYLEDIAHKRENPGMDLWTFGNVWWIPCPRALFFRGHEKPGHWYDTNTNGFNDGDQT